MLPRPTFSSLFFFNDTATTEIYTLSLHDALPISSVCEVLSACSTVTLPDSAALICWPTDRKSRRLNSSHLVISYAVFCLKKKKTKKDYNVNMIRLIVSKVVRWSAAYK